MDTKRYPTIAITADMLTEAERLIPFTQVNRTKASLIDTLTGHIGEMIFAQLSFGDWRKHRVGKNKGDVDFPNIEIKTSAFPFSTKLHLLVREDYAKKRKPAFYVQIILDVKTGHSESIPTGTNAIVCGYATSDEIDRAPLKDFGSKIGKEGGYRCRYIPIESLHPLDSSILP